MLERLGEKIREYFNDNFYAIQSRKETLAMFPHAQGCEARGPYTDFSRRYYGMSGSWGDYSPGGTAYYVQCGECEVERQYIPD